MRVSREVQMDLNYLLHRQQIELSRAKTATCKEARQAHALLAALYENAIEQRTNGRISFVTRPGQRARNWSSELRRLAPIRDSEVTFVSE
jgi:hypothetical protein